MTQPPASIVETPVAAAAVSNAAGLATIQPHALQPRAAFDALLESPERYGFFQAVRLLYRTHGLSPMHGSGREAVRFGVPDTLNFPAGEVRDLSTAPDGVEAQHRLVVNFFGLTGPNGVLPSHYTRWLIARARARDPGPRDFFELFNHRLLLLFWHAWRKHRPELALEFNLGQGALRYVYDLVGMGTPALYERMYPRRAPADPSRRLPGAALGYYSGLVSQRPHGVGSLSQVVGDVVGAPVVAHGCFGTWQRIATRDRTRLGRRAHRLGDGVVLGSRFWDRQTTLQLSIGPLDRDRFDALLPSGELLASVVELTRFLTGLALDLRIKLALKAAQVPRIALGDRGPHRARLGWNTWLSGRRRSTPADEAEFHFSAMGGESWQ